MYNYIRENKVKVTAIVVLIVLLLTTFIGTAIYSKGFTQWGESNDSGFIDGENNIGLDSDKIQELPKSIVATSDKSDTVVFKAIVKPDDAFNKSLTWKLEWSNPVDSWASGKTTTDYINMTVSPTDSTQVSIKCVAPFSIQMKLVATSVQNPAVSATATIDFLKKLLEVKNTMTYDGVNVDLNAKDFVYGPDIINNASGGEDFDAKTFLCNKEYVFTLGTIDPVIENSMTYSLTKEYYDIVSEKFSGLGIVTRFIELPVFDNKFVLSADAIFSSVGMAGSATSFVDEISLLFYDFETREPLSRSNQFLIKDTYSIDGGTDVVNEFVFSFDVDKYLPMFTSVADIIMGGNVIL